MSVVSTFRSIAELNAVISHERLDDFEQQSCEERKKVVKLS